jgi:hypothetical protein
MGVITPGANPIKSKTPKGDANKRGQMPIQHLGCKELRA